MTPLRPLLPKLLPALRLNAQPADARHATVAVDPEDRVLSVAGGVSGAGDGLVAGLVQRGEVWRTSCGDEECGQGGAGRHGRASGAGGGERRAG